MSYRDSINQLGFNQLCKALGLSSKLEQSYYVLVYMINNNNEQRDMLSPVYIKEFKEYFFGSYNPQVPEKDELPKINDSNYNNYLNKCRNGKQNKSYLKFIHSLTDYLVQGNNINPEHFNRIKNNVKDLINYNLINCKPSKGKRQKSEELLFEDFFDLYFDNLFESHGDALAVDDLLQVMQYTDKYAALTWILLFALYPEDGEASLSNLVFNAFKESYEEKNYITPSIISLNTSSSEALCFDMASKYNCTNILVNQKRDDYFNPNMPDKLKPGTSESYEYCHLTFLHAFEFFVRNKSNKTELEDYLTTLENAIDTVEKLGLDDENYWLEYIQLLLLKADFYWRIFKYNDMDSILFRIEMLLYDYYGRTEKYKLLLAKLKRKQGIYFNRMMDFKNVLRTYSTSFFLLDSSMKYERSQVKNNEAFMYKKWMKFDRACMSYKTAIELRKYRESFDPSSLMSLYSNTARAYSYCHNFKDAIDLIDKAYLFRKDNYNIDPNKNRGMYILTTKYYGEILLHMGIYAKKRNEKLNYWNQSREKLAEIYEIVKNYKNMYSTSEYWEIYGQLCYYLREWPKSESYFKTAISQLEPLVASEHRCITANIYLGKIYYSMDNPKVAYDYFSKAFKMSEELLNPYSYCYTRMVAAFNLGGFLYLTAGVVDLPSSEETDLLMLAKELILRSHEDIKALMEPSENIPEEYKYINNIAFKTEEQCIKEFVDNIEKNDNDIETETRKNLKKEFLDFYVSHQ